MFTIEVNSKTGCPLCTKAKAFLTGRQLSFTEILHDDDAARQAFYDQLGLVGGERTVPQVFLVDTESGERYRIGGSRELEGSGIASLFHKPPPRVLPEPQWDPAKFFDQ